MADHTILVVDDEPASVRAIGRTLANDYRVVTASNGTEGLAALAAQPIALMVVDQRMPDMTGTELLARSAAQYPHIIRLLLTGYTGVETLVDAINAGHVYYYLTKPWEPSELRLVVRRGLERYEVESERLRLLGELQQACCRLQREADQKGRLLTITAHELGTPLHVLANVLALMAEAEPAPPLRTWLDTARRNAEWLGRGLAQIAAGGRWQRAPLRLRCRTVDLAAFLEEVRAAHDAPATGRAVAVRVEMAATLPPVAVDPIWLGRALSNLLSNAIRFTPDGGRVTIAAAATAAAVEITVADTGIGIDAGVLDEIFEPFSAAGGDVSLHTSGRFTFGSRGLGLGLAITSAIVAQHGGTIAVRSQRGWGSEFTIRLPLAPRFLSAP